MADPGFPNQHTTTTTVTSSNTTVQTNIRYDPLYLRTLPGALKIAQIIHLLKDMLGASFARNIAYPSLLNLLGFICITVSILATTSRGSWFNTVAMGGFWFTGIMLALYLFHVVEKFYRIPWLKIEFVFCALWAAFYLIAASLAADYGRLNEAFGVAAFFGYLAMVAYGFDAFLKFNAVRSGALAQGERVVNKSSSTVTTPAY